MIFTCLYFIIVLLAYFLLKISYNHKGASIRLGESFLIKQQNNMYSFFTCVLVSGLFTIYNWIVTKNDFTMGADRLNYYLNFRGDRLSSSDGLTTVIYLVKLFGGDVYTLFYVTSFICLLIVLLSIRKMDLSKPKALLMLFLSQYVVFSYTGLKQAYANSLACVFFYLQFSDIKHKRILSIICMICAFIFHPASFILLPIYFILNTDFSRNKIILYVIICILLGFCFEPAMLLAAKILNPIVPSVSSKILDYFYLESSTVAEGGSMFTFIKGIPFYLITIYGLVYRKRIKSVWDNYDKYLLVSITCSFFYLMALYNVWMVRFIYFFLPIVFLMFARLVDIIHFKSRAIVWGSVIISLFIVTARFLLIVFAQGGF